MHSLPISSDSSTGEIISISSLPASRQEMSEYTNVNDGTNQQELALYKAIVKIRDKNLITMEKNFLFQMD